MGNGVINIEADAFYGCTNLTDVVFSNNIQYIGSYAFAFCDSLTNVYISDVGNWCNINFDSYYSNPLFHADNLYLNNILVTELVIPEDVTDISSFAFYGQRNIISIVIPDSVTNIGDYAFKNCDNLESLFIGNGVTTIGYQAFYGCKDLNTVVLGSGIERVQYDAFGGCLIEKVYFAASSRSWIYIQFASNNEELIDATRYYYYEDKPRFEGNFWHYVDGEIVVWG